jgi:hypothetical protein
MMDTILYEVNNTGTPQELLQSFLPPFLAASVV